MATASGKTEGTPRPRKPGSVMPVVAYAVVLALLGLAGVAVYRVGLSGLPGLLGGGPAPATAPAAAPVDPRTARGLKLPPRPAAPEVAALAKQEPALEDEPAPPSQAETEKMPEPPKLECKVDFTGWPVDRTDQAKAVQLLLRDLGLYRGTTNGTVGPATRTAIREFQLASGEAETGEVTEALFEALKKKCAAP
ncbi:MAG: peptidoglycan-binding domain-containing protein [Reyranella sp.]|nr:peptidoglycan-binding domain-containing protein [Reyranella sp.]MDP3158993.1 peptidoglycan-binding domain-containing protein [Reyranella sp.]